MTLNLEMLPLPILAIKCGLGAWAAGALLVFFTANKEKHLFYSALLFIGGIINRNSGLSYPMDSPEQSIIFYHIVILGWLLLLCE